MVVLEVNKKALYPVRRRQCECYRVQEHRYAFNQCSVQPDFLQYRRPVVFVYKFAKITYELPGLPDEILCRLPHRALCQRRGHVSHVAPDKPAILDIRAKLRRYSLAAFNPVDLATDKSRNVL